MPTHSLWKKLLIRSSLGTLYLLFREVKDFLAVKMTITSQHRVSPFKTCKLRAYSVLVILTHGRPHKIRTSVLFFSKEACRYRNLLCPQLNPTLQNTAGLPHDAPVPVSIKIVIFKVLLWQLTLLRSLCNLGKILLLLGGSSLLLLHAGKLLVGISLQQNHDSSQYEWKECNLKRNCFHAGRLKLARATITTMAM